MKGAKRPVGVIVLACVLMLGAASPEPALARSSDVTNARPGEVAMIGDALIVRPVMIGATVVGTALYTVMLPFSLLGGNEDEAADVLVKAPAKTAFLRCLGCTPAQDQMLQDQKRTVEKTEEK